MGRDVPADTFLVLCSEAAGVDAVSDQIYWPDPASEFLYLLCVVSAQGTGRDTPVCSLSKELVTAGTRSCPLLSGVGLCPPCAGAAPDSVGISR